MGRTIVEIESLLHEINVEKKWAAVNERVPLYFIEYFTTQAWLIKTSSEKLLS